MRNLFLAGALAFITLFGALTIVVAVNNGVTPATVLALIILAMIGIGVYGALREPPDG
jgi:hypothetical protein